MSQVATTLSNVHAINGMRHALGELLPVVKVSGANGCTVSSFAGEYIQRVMKSDQVLQYSGYDWETSKVKKEPLTGFSITSQHPDVEGVYFKVTRVVRKDILWNRFRALGLAREFTTNVQERLGFRNSPSAVTSLVLGDTMKTLIGMGGGLVDYKVDHGLHLLIKERPRHAQHLQIYIGGWFDESQFPLAEFEHTRIQNVLRRKG